ncbi:NAD-dependent epimerase/dehydratase family protein [Streptomyces spongiae]|uniref:NAD-dependent epimerase/dehydratase family protein n=1 Tax=Streptomyces spongiae TaxID=565072 RepID=A0A5N8XHE9_9ACTN|nr:NAD-dependent epimerase/dehydratase family protein [Streptomyces spongiae]MPY58933.1 NAD-dependent epimerase/dehydratase family protein [Streptomyces spongiae]
MDIPGDTPGDTPGAAPHAVVTGAAGFIGSHLVTGLLSAGCRVTAVDVVPWTSAHQVRTAGPHAHLRYHEADLRDTRTLRGLTKDARWIFHLGANTENRSWAQSGRADLDTTVTGTVALLEALVEHPPQCVVMTSSQLVYGDRAAHDVPLTGRPPRPATRFGAGKAAAEAFLCAAAHETGFHAVAARLSNVVGAGMRRGIIHDFVGKLRQDPTRLTVLGDGSQKRSYLHVSDCVSALTTLAEAAGGRSATERAGFEAYDVCNTDATAAAEVARIAVAEFPGADGEILLGSGQRGWKGDIPTVRVSPRPLLDLGWQPRLTSSAAVRTAVREIIAEGPLEPPAEPVPPAPAAGGPVHRHGSSAYLGARHA